jgi:hypothetical protein
VDATDAGAAGIAHRTADGATMRPSSVMPSVFWKVTTSTPGPSSAVGGLPTGNADIVMHPGSAKVIIATLTINASVNPLMPERIAPRPQTSPRHFPSQREGAGSGFALR